MFSSNSLRKNYYKQSTALFTNHEEITNYRKDKTTPGYESIKVTGIKESMGYTSVSYSIRKSKFCINCLHYGYTSTNCHSSTRCIKIYGNNFSSNCNSSLKSTYINFKGAHSSDSSFCSLYEEQNKILMAYENIIYNIALLKGKESRSSTSSYTRVAAVSNTVDELDDQFPYLHFNYTFAVKRKKRSNNDCPQFLV